MKNNYNDWYVALTDTFVRNDTLIAETRIDHAAAHRRAQQAQRDLCAYQARWRDRIAASEEARHAHQ